MLVEGVEFGNGEYLSELIDYVHLNPVRAELIETASKSEPERIPMEKPGKRLLGCGA